LSLNSVIVNITEKAATVVNLITAMLPKPYVDVRDYSSFAAAVGAIGSTKKTLLIPNEQPVSANIIDPSNIELWFLQGGSLSIATGVTVTINGHVEAGLYQIFKWTGTGKVVFGAEAIKERYPEWWGADGHGTIDDTVPVQAAFTSLLPYSTIGLKGNYLISSINIVDQEGIQINSYNARLIGKDTGDYTHLLSIATSPCVSINGQLLIDTQFNLGYDCAIWVKSGHLKAWNITFYKTALCWKFGDVALPPESGVAENFIFGSHFHACLRNVEIYGANSIVFFNGSLIHTGPLSDCGDAEWQAAHPAWCAADFTSVRIFGGILYVTGGELVCHRADDTNPAINLQPVNTTPPYNKEYGKAKLSNTHVETPKLCLTTNPGSIVSTDIGMCLDLIGCYGFVANLDLIFIECDNLFIGGIDVRGCDFYAPVMRVNEAINALNPLADIYVDDSSFGRNFIVGPPNFVGGTLHFLGKGETWIAATLLGAWVNFGAGYAAVGYSKDRFGMVHIKGVVKDGVITTSVFTLPAGYRPADSEKFTCNSSGGIVDLMINPSGDVIPATGANAWLSLSGTAFRAV